MSIEYVRGRKDGQKRKVYGHGVYYNLGRKPEERTHEVCDLELDGQLVKQVIRLDRIEREKQ